MPAGSTWPGCQSSDNQPVYSEGVTLESMHEGQGQHNDRPLVYLQRHVSPTQAPSLVAYLQSQSGSGHGDNWFSPVCITISLVAKETSAAGVGRQESP